MMGTGYFLKIAKINLNLLSRLLPSFPSAFARFAPFPRSRFPRSRDHPKGLLAVYFFTKFSGSSFCLINFVIQLFKVNICFP